MLALVDSDTPYPVGVTSQGYPYLRVGGNQVLLHRLVVENSIGRELQGDECVHHINYNKLDCRRENLLLCPNQAYHKLIHARTDYINQGYNPDTHHFCSSCKVFHTKDFFPKNKNEWNGVYHMCKDSTNKRRREKQYSKGKFGWLQRLQQQYRRIDNSYTKRDICWITREGNCP